MVMKKFINDPANLTDELLEGLALANADLIELQFRPRTMLRRLYRRRNAGHCRYW